MQRAGLFGLALLLYVGHPTVGFAVDPPDLAKWQAAMEATAVAVRDNDAGRLRVVLPRLFEQALRFNPADDRGDAARVRFFEGYGSYLRLRPLETEPLLTELAALTRVDGAVRSNLSTTPTVLLAGLRQSQGQPRKARELWTEFADRASAELGDVHVVTWRSRIEEVRAASASAEFEYAVTRIEALQRSTVQAFGPNDARYVDLLIIEGEVHASAEQYPELIATADDAAEILRSMQPRTRPLLTGVANLYWYSARFEKARSFYRDAIAAASAAGELVEVAELLMALSGVEARLGNGADARDQIDLARKQATKLTAESPGLLYDVMVQEEYLHGFAGNTAGSLATLRDAERFIAERRLRLGPGGRLRIARGFIDSGAYAEGIGRIETLMRGLPPWSEDYASANELLVRANALSDPPKALTSVAEGVVRFYEERAPASADDARLALALSYRAEGRIDEALALERATIERTRATIGEHAIHPAVWKQHAATLRLAGEDAAAEVAAARARAEQERFAEGWLR